MTFSFSTASRDYKKKKRNQKTNLMIQPRFLLNVRKIHTYLVQEHKTAVCFKGHVYWPGPESGSVNEERGEVGLCVKHKIKWPQTTT